MGNRIFGFACRDCGSANVKVINSRKYDESVIRRRRRCNDCGYRFSTKEILVDVDHAEEVIEGLKEAEAQLFSLRATVRRNI